MFDFLAFLESYGWINAIGILGIVLFGLVVKHELSILGKEYKLALKRIELLEQSVKEADRVICRSECLDLLRSIDGNVKRFL